MPRSLTTIDSWAACRGLIHGRLTVRIPDGREKSREFRGIGLFFAKPTSKATANAVACEMSSLRDSAGNYFARAGNYFRLFDRSREFRANPVRSAGRIRSPQRLLI